MNQGPNPPSGSAGGKGRRRRRGRRGPAPNQPNQQQGKPQGQGGQGQGQQYGQGHSQSQGQGQNRNAGGRRFGKKRTGGHKPGGARPASREPLGGVYSAPMDHSYRAVLQEHDGNTHSLDRGRGKPFTPEAAPQPVSADTPTRIYAFVDDLFFLAKITETARKLGVKVEFVKTEKDVFDRMGQNGNDKPTLIIVDLNNLNAKPLAVIPKLKSKLKKETNIIGFVSHVQGELKLKATEAGCDVVLPRSAFSQNLAQLLRRHAVLEEELPEPNQPN